jgi:hypothetical protein
MTDIIERAARAACIEAGIAPDAEYRGGEIGIDWNWQSFVPEARAVLHAIREPSDGMVEAGKSDGDWPHARETWVSMIDKALGEE